MAITQGIQSPGLAFRDSTTDEDVSVTELRQAVDQTNQNTSDISTINSELIKKTSYVENRFKGNQVPVIEGTTGDNLVGSTPTDYAAGAEPALGYYVTTASTNLTYVSGVWSSSDNIGVIERRYKKDSSGFITKSNQYGCVKLADGTQIDAQVDDITGGVSIFEDGGFVKVAVDLSNAAIIAAGGFSFIGLSPEKGELQHISEDESAELYFDEVRKNRTLFDVTSSIVVGNAVTNNKPYPISLIFNTQTQVNHTFEMQYNGAVISASTAATQAFIHNVQIEILPGETYNISIYTGQNTIKVLEGRLQ